MFKHCISCHRDGEIAPFALTNYSETKRRASTIKDRVLSGYMPPWKAQANYGHFVNERRLSDDEKKTLSDWVDAGSPEGDVSKMPALPSFPKGSQLGTPDLVLRLPIKWQIHGDNQDVYRNFVIPTGLIEDKVIAAIEVRPDNRKVVHHVLMWNDTSGQARKLDANDALEGYEEFGGAGFNNPVSTYPGWAPGAATMFFPNGIGLKMHKNSDLIVQMHYAPSPTDEEDQTVINVFFKNESVTRFIREGSILPDHLPNGYNGFIMPANKISTFKGTYNVSADISALAVFPHMHKLGISSKLYAVTTKKDTIPMISIPAWDFNWQGEYSYQNLKKIPKGSKVYYEASYDNTADNPFNPNSPPKQMGWGFKTTEEMYLCYLFYLPYKAGDEDIVQTTSVSYESTPERSSIDVRGISPNPVASTARLDFQLFTAERLSIDVVDLNGRVVVLAEKDRLFAEGEHQVSIPVGNLSSALYLCRIQLGTKTITLPFSVAK